MVSAGRLRSGNSKSCSYFTPVSALQESAKPRLLRQRCRDVWQLQAQHGSTRAESTKQEGNLQQGLVETHANAVRLRAPCRRARAIDVLNGKMELVLVVGWLAAELSASGGERPTDGNLVSSKNETTRSFVRSAPVRGVLHFSISARDGAIRVPYRHLEHSRKQILRVEEDQVSSDVHGSRHRRIKDPAL
jgi:hypothetical protein